MVISDIEALAQRIGPGNPAKGIGIAANQSASLVALMETLAKKQDNGGSLFDAAQRDAADGGSVPAYFRYQDPDGNVIRALNPSDATWRERDGSYAGPTDLKAEGCLSSIEFRGRVIRPLTMVVDGEDLEGKLFRIKALGPAARLLGHEVSHVNGGIDGLCVLEGRLPVFTIGAYEKLPADVIDWYYTADFRRVPYLEFSDPEGKLETPQLVARLSGQGLFTSACGNPRSRPRSGLRR